VSGDGFNEKERARQLMMAALDGEISGEDRRELDRYLETDAGLRDEWETMGRVKEVTSSMAFREPPEEVWSEYWTSVYNRVERGIGWIFISIGAVVVLAYAAWEVVHAMFEDSDVPMFLKVAILAIAVGFLVLAVSVIREKLFTRRRDPYKEIER
jgi:hypothetical protein